MNTKNDFQSIGVAFETDPNLQPQKNLKKNNNIPARHLRGI